MAWVRAQLRRLFYGAVVFLIVGMLLGVVRLLAAPSAIRLKSTPSSAFAGSVFRFEIRLTPDASDRWITLAFDPTDIVGDSAWTIAGASALPIYQMSRRLTEPGTYHAVAAVGHQQTVRASSVITLVVAE